MTDRELLEMAAKAAGYRYRIWVENNRDHDSNHYGMPCLCGPFYPNGDQPYEADSWNPLEDDGDAFCLAVDLRIAVNPFFSCVRAVTDRNFEGDGYAIMVPDCDRHDAGKRAKYMRYAIVSAAAGISRSIP